MTIRRNHNKSSDKVLEIKRWALMMLDWVSAYYGVTKSELLRALIQTLESQDKELKNPRDFHKSSGFFNEKVLFHFMLSKREELLLTEVASSLKLSQAELVASLLLSRLDLITDRYQQNKPRNKDRETLQHRQVYVSEELVDALYTLRDQRGESVSLLLKEAVNGHRKRVTEKLPMYRRERNVNLRLTSQEWSKLDQIAAATDIESSEAVASLLIEHYFC
jgi:hypothetical protein